MSMKLSHKENAKKTVSSYNMKSFNCEICKTPYPLRFKSGNNYFDLIDSERPSDNYIVLESLNQLKDNNNYKSIHVITLKEDEKIIMGRGHDSDVRINDISVSRTHSCLMLSKGKVYLTDYKSKFGTLVLMQKPVEITESKLFLQIGRTLAELVSVTENEKGNKISEKYEFFDKKNVEKGAANSANDKVLLNDFSTFLLDKESSTNFNGLYISPEKFKIDDNASKIRKGNRNQSK